MQLARLPYTIVGLHANLPGGEEREHISVEEKYKVEFHYKEYKGSWGCNWQELVSDHKVWNRSGVGVVVKGTYH